MLPLLLTTQQTGSHSGFEEHPKLPKQQESLLHLQNLHCPLRRSELFWLINLVPGIQLKFESFLKSTVQASCHS